MDFISRRHKWANISIGLPWLQSTINLLSFTSSNQRNHHLVIFWFDFSWFHNQQQIDQILLPPWIILKILFQFYDHDHDLVFFPFVILQRVGDDMIRMQIKLDSGDTAGCETETSPCWLGVRCDDRRWIQEIPRFQSQISCTIYTSQPAATSPLPPLQWGKNRMCIFLWLSNIVQISSF